MSELRVSSRGALSGRMIVPGDKSISHRAVMLSAVALGETRILGLLDSEDVRSTASAMRSLGVPIENTGDEVVVKGGGPAALNDPEGDVYLGNSGTSMRILAGLFSGLGIKAVLTGDESLSKRPMKRIIEPLTLMGADIRGSGEGTAPLAIGGGKIKGISYELPVASAQVKSSILLAGLFGEGETRVKELAPTRDHTERMLPAFGVEVKRQRPWFSVMGGQKLVSPGEIVVPGDVSSAAFFMVAAAVAPGSRLVIQNVGVNPTRTGVIDALLKMGANITLTNERRVGEEPVADVEIIHGPLGAADLNGELVARAIDEIPALCVAASLARGVTRIRDAGELRVKESDRITAMARMLADMGVAVREYPDGLDIEGPARLKGSVVDCGMDHRIAMAAAVAGLSAEGETVIKGAETIETSFPNFHAALTEVLN